MSEIVTDSNISKNKFGIDSEYYNRGNIFKKLPCNCEKDYYDRENCSNIKKILKRIEVIKKNSHQKKAIMEIKNKNKKSIFIINTSIFSKNEKLNKLFTKKKDFNFTESAILQSCLCCKEKKKDIMEEKEIEQVIEKDIKRTFKKNKYFQTKSISFLLKEILLKNVFKYPFISYVQGMNFIGASIVYHCKNFCKCFKIYDFLFENLQMNFVYCFKKFSSFLKLLKILLDRHVKELSDFFFKLKKIDLKILILDWFFTL